MDESQDDFKEQKIKMRFSYAFLTRKVRLWPSGKGTPRNADLEVIIRRHDIDPKRVAGALHKIADDISAHPPGGMGKGPSLG